VRGQFAAWKTTHNKVYATADEEANALAAYIENDRIIEEHNAKKLSWTLGHNEFSDMTWETFRNTVMSELFLNRNPVNARRVMLKTGLQGAADSVDWVSKGAVTAVKNQQRCGSCWAFSTTGALEGAWQIETGKLVQVSEQQFVDCDKSSNGCGGGLMSSAFQWAESQDLCTEQEYSYEAVDGSCRANGCTGIAAGGITGYKSVSSSKSALESAITKGPVSVAIEADQSAFQFYTGGVMSGTCGTQLDHGVLAVGYDSESWIVKNSWGASWGESGYIRLTNNGNQCGILNSAAYPVVSSSVTV